MRVGGYEVLGEVGRGGASVVYRARGPDGRDVAVKVLRGGSSPSRERFERERSLLARLGEREGFVPLLDSGESSGERFIVMPFLPGGTLRDRLARGPLPVEEAVALGRTLGEALGRAHALGIVHRDLKPENVLFDGRAGFTAAASAGHPLVADLGLAKSQEMDASLSKTGELRGTVGYMPPEQMRDAKSVGPRADVFALGAILFEALTGSPPFPGDTALEVIGQVEGGHVPRVAALRPCVPRRVARAIESALAREERDRPADGAAFARALSAAPTSWRARAVALVVAAASTVMGLAAATRREAPASGASPAFASCPAPTPAGTHPGAAPASAPAARRLGELPAVCADFARTRSLRLVQVLGDYSWKTTAAVRYVAFVDEGRAVAAVDDDAIARVFELPDGAERVSLAIGREPPVAIAAAPRERRLCTASAGERAKVYDGATRTAISLGERTDVTAAAWSQDARLVATGCSDGRIVVYTGQGRVDGTLNGGHTSPVSAMAFLPDGRGLLSAARGGGLELWDFRRKTGVGIEGGARVHAIAVSPDGALALAARGDGALSWIDLANGSRASATETGHAGAVVAVAFAPDGRTALTGGEDGAIAVWDVATRLPLARHPGSARSPVRSLAVSPDGRLVLASGETLRLLDAKTGEDRLRARGGASGSITAIAPLGDDRIVAGSRGGGLRILDESTGNATFLEDHLDRVTAIAVSPDRRHIASGGANRTLRAFDAATGECVARGELPTAIAGVAFAPDGRLLTAGVGGSVREHALPGLGQVGERLDAHEARLIAIWTDGRRVVTWGGEPRLKLWSERALAWSVPAPVGSAGTLAATPAGNWVATGADDGTLRVFSLADGAERQRIEPGGGEALCAAASPDARRLASGWRDQRLRIHDPGTGAELDLACLGLSADYPTALAYARGGRELLVGTARGIVLRFEVDDRP